MERAPSPVVDVEETEETVGGGPGAATGPRLCRFPRPDVKKKKDAAQ